MPADFGEHARIMMDLLTLAFQTDATRVVDAVAGAGAESAGVSPRSGFPRRITA